jgi:hypothetical protein
MTLYYDPAQIILQGQNIRPPLGSFFNGQSYWIKLLPEIGRSDRSVLVVRMVLQFQFSDGDNSSWTTGEKTKFAQDFISETKKAWNDKFRITTTSTTPVRKARDVGVMFQFPYFIDGWHTSDDFELSIKKVPSSDPWKVSSCKYSSGNVTLDSNDLRPETKGATMKQCDAVHEFGHMLGLRDEYAAAKDNPYHVGDKDSIMNVGQLVRNRHYAPFAAWLTDQFKTASRLSGSIINYKVDGTIDMTNARL